MNDNAWKTAELILTGNELLNGNILDTNSQWIAKELTSIGIQVRRMTVIEDRVDIIADAIRGALGRRPNYIITSGGLGPTYDDVTLEGVAKALNKKLQTNSIALRMVQERYHLAEKAGILRITDVESSMGKMATLPWQSTPLPNPAGAAPGVMIEHEATVIFSVPGVPSEMKAIFNYSIIPWIKNHLGSAFHFEKTLLVTGVAEALLAPTIVEAMRTVGDTWIKSCVKGHGKSEVCISTTALTEDEAERRVRKATQMIMEGAIKAGAKIEEKSTENPEKLKA
ncbi:MAG: molybdopterin-binding protein [Candidatus Atabeyarchaeum deiterrae]